jgi:putative transposase
VSLSPYLQFVQDLLRQVLALVCQTLTVRYFVFDGAFGHNQALQMVRRTGLELISKLRHNSALYLPYDGPYAGRGPRRKYGSKLDYQHLPPCFLKATSVEGHVHTAIYQLPVWHKKFPDRLNVVILVKTNQRTGAQAHVILFSSDLELGYEALIDYYRLRFQIEFNFRDAKQYWGLEDFMVTKPTPVYNSANLAMLMINLSQILMRPVREHCPSFSVNDLKAHFRGRKYVLEVLKMLPEMPEANIIDQALEQAANLGRINQELSAA